jgi:hypothetical protein
MFPNFKFVFFLIQTLDMIAPLLEELRELEEGFVAYDAFLDQMVP